MSRIVVDRLPLPPAPVEATYRAGFDFLKVKHPERLTRALPTLREAVDEGRLKQQGVIHTLHDPQRRELAALIRAALPLLEVELAVDGYPVTGEGQDAAALHAHHARTLWPFGNGKRQPRSPIAPSARRTRKRAKGGELFSAFGVIPDTVYFGHKRDIAQVRAYWKRTDRRGKRALDGSDMRARVELTFRDCEAVGLATTAELASCNWRHLVGPVVWFADRVTFLDVPRAERPPGRRRTVGTRKAVRAGHASLGVNRVREDGVAALRISKMQINQGRYALSADGPRNRKVGAALDNLTRSLARLGSPVATQIDK